MQEQTPGVVQHPAGAVFLSYASEDAEAADRLCEALRGAGIEVWFDRNQLRGGDVWDAEIRRQIKACALFVPVLSRHTHARDEGYFRLEWKLAVDRSHLMVDSKTFLMPVVIDDTPDDDTQVPDRFRAVQWTRLAGGTASAAFVERVRVLLARGTAVPQSTDAAPAAAVADPRGAATPRRPGPARRRVAALGIGLGLLAIAALGYWIVGLQRQAAGPGGTGGQAPAAERTVAVLPFVNMSSDPEQEYFSQGLAEELIDVLTKIPGLRVPARTSSFSFRGKSVTIGEIARALGVRHILEGSVRKAGNRLRVTAQLVRADDGFHVWSQTYDRDVTDVFAVQDDIARSVAGQLRVTLLEGASSASARDVTPEAYGLYLQARFRTERETMADLTAAVELYQRAIAAAPRYAASWAWLAYTQTRRIANGDTSEANYRAAREAAARSIELDPALAEGYVAGGIAALQYSLDWVTAQRLLDQGLARDPNNPLALQFRAHLTQATGSVADAESYLRRAAQLDPLNPLHARYLARIVLNAGRADESAAILRQAIEEQRTFPALHYELARALLVAGKPAEAAAEFEAEPDATWRLLGLPIAYHITHREPQARAALARLLANSAGAEFQVAEAYAAFGDADRAFEWLEHARERHDAGLMYLAHDRLLSPLVGDPRFATLLAGLHLPAATRAD